MRSESIIFEPFKKYKLDINCDLGIRCFKFTEEHLYAMNIRSEVIIEIPSYYYSARNIFDLGSIKCVNNLYSTKYHFSDSICRFDKHAFYINRSFSDYKLKRDLYIGLVDGCPVMTTVKVDGFLKCVMVDINEYVSYYTIDVFKALDGFLSMFFLNCQNVYTCDWYVGNKFRHYSFSDDLFYKKEDFDIGFDLDINDYAVVMKPTNVNNILFIKEGELYYPVELDVDKSFDVCFFDRGFLYSKRNIYSELVNYLGDEDKDRVFSDGI